MTPPINIDGSEVTGITIDGSSVSEVTVDGQTVFPSNTIPDSGVTRYSCENPNADTSVIADVWGPNDASNVNGVSYNASGGPDGTGEYQYDRSQSQYSSTSIQNYSDSFTFALLATHTDIDNVDLISDISGTFSGIQLTYRSDNMRFTVFDSGGNLSTIDTNVNTAGTYQWFIITHDESTSETHGYLDKTQYGPVVGGHVPNPDTDIKIAKRGSRSSNHPTMDMADFRHYNKPISQSEVDSLVDTGRI
jgi:hypothetical protein